MLRGGSFGLPTLGEALRFAGLLPEDVARSAQVPRPEASPMSAALAVFERGSQVGSELIVGGTADRRTLARSGAGGARKRMQKAVAITGDTLVRQA